jgi:hypothetical protein
MYTKHTIALGLVSDSSDSDSLTKHVAVYMTVLSIDGLCSIKTDVEKNQKNL